MKAEGLTTTKNLGGSVSSFNSRHHVSSTGAVTTAANRPVQGNGVNAGHNTNLKAGTSDHRSSAVTTSGAAAHGAAAAGGAGHGAGRSK